MGSVQKPKLDPWDRPGKALEWHRVKLTWVLSLSLDTLSFRGPQWLPVKDQEPPPCPPVHQFHVPTALPVYCRQPEPPLEL